MGIQTRVIEMHGSADEDVGKSVDGSVDRDVDNCEGDGSADGDAEESDGSVDGEADESAHGSVQA